MICDEFSPAPESAQAEATGFGVAAKQLVPLNMEPGTGAAMMNEGVVSVRKVGA